VRSLTVLVFYNNLFVSVIIYTGKYMIMFVSFNSNTTDVTSGAGISNSPGAPKSPQFLVGFVLHNLFCVKCCRSLFVINIIIYLPVYIITETNKLLMFYKN
jgi:hypothetical protein